MIPFWTRATALAVSAAALTACQTTPTYPVRQGYVPPRPLEEIDADLNKLVQEITQLLNEVEA